jgi:DinB superfamily
MSRTDSVFHAAISKLLTEVFDGPPGGEAYVLNPGDPGLLRQLESLSAEAASRRPSSSRPPIAAHVDHVYFGLSLINRWLAGEENPWAGADWNASWQIESVTEEQWRALLGKLRDASTTWQAALRDRKDWDPVNAAGAISSVAHTAYHLGAIRQILGMG